MKQWLPDDHLVYFVMDVVGQLDLGTIYRCYDSSKGGQPPFDPRMMVGLLFYSYCIGLRPHTSELHFGFSPPINIQTMTQLQTFANAT
jgi:hypothetical protein